MKQGKEPHIRIYISASKNLDTTLSEAIATGFEKADAEMFAANQFIIEDTTVDILAPAKPHQWLVAQDDVSFFDIGGLSIIQGEQKSGKSRLTNILASVILGNRFGNLQPAVNGYFTQSGDYIPSPNDNQPRRVLIIDTEQGTCSCDTALRRLYKMLNLPTDRRDSRIWMESVCQLDVADRRDLIEARLIDLRPQIVFVDGVVDLVENFNDFGESNELVGWLNNLAKRYQCHIVNILHENFKGTSEGKVRGALGTTLRCKVSLALRVKRDKEKDIFTVSTDVSRFRDVKDFCFVLDEEGNPHLTDADKAQLSNRENEMVNFVSSLFQMVHSELQCNVLIDAFKNKYSIKDRAAKMRIAECVEANILKKSGYGKYQLGDKAFF